MSVGNLPSLLPLPSVQYTIAICVIYIGMKPCLKIVTNFSNNLTDSTTRSSSYFLLWFAIYQSTNKALLSVTQKTRCNATELVIVMYCGYIPVYSCSLGLACACLWPPLPYLHHPHQYSHSPFPSRQFHPFQKPVHFYSVFGAVQMKWTLVVTCLSKGPFKASWWLCPTDSFAFCICWFYMILSLNREYFHKYQ